MDRRIMEAFCPKCHKCNGVGKLKAKCDVTYEKCGKTNP